MVSYNIGASATISADPTQPSTPAPEIEEYYSSWSLFIVCILMIFALWTSYYLQIKRIRAIHETVVSIFAGMCVGLVVRLAPGTLIREMLNFKHTLFFNLLLPPIILNSGYELKQENFFRNFGSILTFAFLGTFISAVGLGVLVYIYSFLGLENISLTLLECLIFGSTLSATDPVTILAIFQQHKVDPKLYSVIFGESILNDAVSIVMYETLSQFHGTEIYLSSLFHGIGIFLLSFTVSMALGVAFGLFMSLTLKHSSLSLYPSIESCLVALVAYTSYFFSNGLSMSGIVSLLFCGITLKHYAYHTMSRRTQRTTKYIFAILAQLSENFIFIYLGLSLFTSAPSDSSVGSYFKPLFVTIVTVCVIFTRYAAVFPLSELINLFHRHVRHQRTEELPHSYQMMLFWAGLRGAVGVALAAGFQGPNAQVLRMTVLVVVVLTVVLFGGTTSRMLEVLGIRVGVEDGNASDSDDEWVPALGSVGVSRRRAPSGSRWGGGAYNEYNDWDEQELTTPGGHGSGEGAYNHHYRHKSQETTSATAGGYSPYINPAPRRPQSRSRLRSSNSGNVSPVSSESSDAGEVLPLASAGYRTPGGTIAHSPAMPSSSAFLGAASSSVPAGPSNPSASSTALGVLGGITNELSAAVGEDGKWFQTLDERYLLPLFSNATASRTHQARKARRMASGASGGGGSASMSPSPTPGGSDDDEEGDISRGASDAYPGLGISSAELGSASTPGRRSTVAGEIGRGEPGTGGGIGADRGSDFTGSMSDFFGHLRRGVSSVSTRPTPRRAASAAAPGDLQPLSLGERDRRGGFGMPSPGIRNGTGERLE
ncbi:sodium/hydrogen exchanger [Sistotremastrum niveocremeum HHB9708]|uniref:Sodium/hydrogen exchanger n=2 Tax=Sistotremastraceae TaxID=3402574 RepID=A0A164X6J4_9AGAM|nr:sodium/hydrogen exchanger [Sistotremastrum niveocremeum HHB9708]KZT35667.1 sodium/hydrogen exchanger [Sistotremastrum suecicum HHB10207 ss-3]